MTATLLIGLRIAESEKASGDAGFVASRSDDALVHPAKLAGPRPATVAVVTCPSERPVRTKAVISRTVFRGSPFTES